MSEPIIFLDVEGCLNYTGCGWMYDPKTKKSYKRRNGMYGFVPELVDRLNWLVERTGAKIVVSSAWRLDPDYKEVFLANGVKEVIDRTGQSECRTRGCEVQAWLDAHPEVTECAIIDDDSDFLIGQPLFQTDASQGLTDAIAAKIFEHLTKL